MKPGILIKIQFMFFSLSLGVCCLNAFAGETNAVAKSNLEVMQNLAGQIANDIIDSCNISEKDSIILRFASSTDGWIVQNSMMAAFRNHGYTVFSENDSSSITGIAVHCSGVNASVRYTDMFRDGVFGTKKVRRSVVVGCSCNVSRTGSNEILHSAMYTKQLVDSVLVDDVTKIEIGSVGSTHGELPADSFLDRIAEPFVIIGATGVAIYLFFHIRG